MKFEKTILFSLLLGIVLTLGSTIRYETYSVPDAEEVRYGVPFFWLYHQTSSIAGPVNIWSIRWLNFGIDFVIWFIISALVVYAIDRYRKQLWIYPKV